MSQLLFLLIVSPFAFFQDADTAERLYENAITLKNSGNYKEALTDFERLTGQFADSPWAPMALLELGTYYLHVEGNHTKALDAFNQIQNKYPSSSSAPGAFYYKAFMLEQRAQLPQELEAAASDLIRLIKLYPDNSWIDGAHFLLGLISARLNQFDTSLNALQRLEFQFPKSPFLARALVESAISAALDGKTGPAKHTFARLQSLDPDSDQADRAAEWLLLLDRLSRTDRPWRSDSSFYFAVPKRFTSPDGLAVDGDGNLFVRDDNGVYSLGLSENKPNASTAVKGIVDFNRDRLGELWFVSDNRVASKSRSFQNLTVAGQPLRDLRSAAFDDYNRLFLVDADQKDLLVFNQDGVFQRGLAVSKPKLVRCFRDQVWVMYGDGTGLVRWSANLEQKLPTPSNLSGILDFCFDSLGNLYVLFDKGYQVAVYQRGSELRALRNLKNETFPLKQAQAIAVDATGAIYLSDRRNGSVFRFY